MAEFGRFDISQFRELQKKLQKLQNNKEKLFEACIKALAAELLRRVIKRTPVGKYGKKVKITAKRNSKHHQKGDVYYVHKGSKDGKNGGTLRRGWKVSISKSGSNYIAVISNAVPYAVYVEYGHRTVNHVSWVPGKFMLTISEQELEKIAPQILKKKFDEFLGGV